MMPYPVSGSSADRGKTSGSVPADDVVPGKLSARPDWDDAAVPNRSTSGNAAAGGNCPDVAPDWSRYIDSRLKQFCTR
jgi:hypothetical protein